MKETFYFTPQNTGETTVTVFSQWICSIEWEWLLEQVESAIVYVSISGGRVSYYLLREDARKLWSELNN